MRGPLKQVGAGTQKVQAELEAYFPGIQVARMDADTVNAVNTHEKILERFQRENLPVLLGTQMVAKGLNLERVTLVGVLDGDLSSMWIAIGRRRPPSTCSPRWLAGQAEASVRAGP